MQSLLCRQLEHAQHREIGVVVPEHPVDPVVERLLGIVEMRDMLLDRPRARGWTASADLLGQVAGQAFEIGCVGGEERQDGHRVCRLGVVGVEDGHEPAKATRPRPALGTMGGRSLQRDVAAGATHEDVRRLLDQQVAMVTSSQLGRTQLERPDQAIVRRAAP